MQSASYTQLGLVHNLLHFAQNLQENMEQVYATPSSRPLNWTQSNQIKPLDLSTKKPARSSQRKRRRPASDQLLHDTILKLEQHQLNLGQILPASAKSTVISSSTSPLSASSPLSLVSSGASSTTTSSNDTHPAISSSQNDNNSKPIAKIEKQTNAKSKSSSTKIKSHLCLECGRSFSRSDMLTRHSRLHTGVKPYKCHQCGQVFSRSDHLATHERTHTGEKPYRCQRCAYSACRRDMITRHMRTHSASVAALAAAAGLKLSHSIDDVKPKIESNELTSYGPQ